MSAEDATLEQLRRLRALRELRERIGRARLGSAQREHAAAIERRDAALTESRRLEDTIEARNREARAELLAGAGGIGMARLALQYQIRQEELLASLKAAAEASKAEQHEADSVRSAHQSWTRSGRSVQKTDVLRDRIVARIPVTTDD